MKIKSIPTNPTITLSTLNELIKMYEDLDSRAEDNEIPTGFAYDLGRLSTFELFLKLLGVQFEAGDQA